MDSREILSFALSNHR
uniref:Uncharacterized protein n=2 Tax=Lepeophtheirus salmonis TaxID=72036 RepID=A0A0K2U9Y1_LEPSM